MTALIITLSIAVCIVIMCCLKMSGTLEDMDRNERDQWRREKEKMEK